MSSVRKNTRCAHTSVGVGARWSENSRDTIEGPRNDKLSLHLSVVLRGSSKTRERCGLHFGAIRIDCTIADTDTASLFA